MDFAHRIDEKNTLLNPSNSHAPKAGSFTRNFPSNCTVTVDANKSSFARPSITSAATANANTTSQLAPFHGRVFKKLADVELQDKFAKGLCYGCDAKFSPGHRCANKQLHVLILEGDEDEADTADQKVESESAINSLQLSMFSMFGLTSKKTIKLWGDLLNHRVLVLVDCGASHNFISSVLVQNLDLQFKPKSSFTVKVGDGRKILCLGVCSQLTITLQRLQVQQDFYVFDLGNVDIVLGMEWLAQLGEFRANFGDLILKVPTSSGFHVLQGDPTLSRAPTSLKKPCTKHCKLQVTFIYCKLRHILTCLINTTLFPLG